MKNAFHKIYLNSVYVTALLFLILYFVLSFHSRLAGDDFFYLWLKNTYGAWDGMLYQYREWSGRWTAHSIGCAMISWWKKPLFLPLINTVTIASLFFSLKMLIENILSEIKIDAGKSLIYPLTFSLIACFFFSSYSIGETWFWYIIIITYLWSIISFIFLLNCVFSRKDDAINYLLIAVFSTFIGGASESYALIFILGLFAILIYRWKTLKTFPHLKNSKVDSRDLKIIVALIILSISFAFSAFAPGTEIRHSMLPQTTVSEKLFAEIKAYIKFFVRFLPGKILYIILFSTPWFFFGSVYLKDRFSIARSIEIIRNSSLLFLVVLAVMLIPTTFVMSETGPDRALSIVSITTAIYFTILFSFLGIIIGINKKVVNKILFFLSFSSSLVLIYTMYSQYKLTSRFADAFTDRMNTIENAKKNNFTGILELKKMPSEGMLYWDEVSIDTSYFTNKHLRDGLGVAFTFKLNPDSYRGEK